MASPEESLKDEVREKLVAVFEDKPEDLWRILYFLDEEDKAYKDNPGRPYAPQWKSLKAMLKVNKAFQEYAQQLSEDTRQAKKDQEFRKRMNTIYEEMMSYNNDEVAVEKYQKLDPSRLLRLGIPVQSAIGGFANAWSKIPAKSQANILKSIGEISKNSKCLMTPVDETVSLINKYGGKVVMVGLAAVYLTFDALKNISRWWKGEISGKRCVKNVLDTTLTLAAGMGGGMLGAFAGSFLGPAGTLVGGVIGGFVSSAGAQCLSDLLTQKLFGLPKDEALENAYRYLNVKMTASNAEINKAFHKLCLEHHPDKGGKADDFHFLQCNMAVIKQARGDL